MLIRKCTKDDLTTMFEIINQAAVAYKGVIPEDRWHEPYMPMEELGSEISDGVEFWGLERDSRLVGIMGIQDRGEVTLIRHAYVHPDAQRLGIGGRLLDHLEALTDKPVLIGTWADATWAVAFYQKNGYEMTTREQKTELLHAYWSIPDRQVETSVVLAKGLSGAR
jgi:GNAT superfamily N-acetyltransferase